jgi:site-specific DNA recombinase
MMPLRGSRAALYARVSLEEQAKHGFSIDGQLDALRRYCNTNLLDVYDVYIDAGASGKSTGGRPELKRMLEDGKSHRFDTIVIWRISRLSRNLSDLLEMVQLFKQHNISLRSFNEQFDTDTELGNFVLQMMGAAAQLERDNIAENVKFSSQERSRQGMWNGGNNVLGYQWVRSPEVRTGRVEVIPEEAELVRRIFAFYATGLYGLKAITNRLNKEGLKTKTGKPFNIHSVKGILQNQNYLGMIRFNVTENRRTKGVIPILWATGEHEPIIATELWEQVHAIYATHSKTTTCSIKRSFPLTGLLKCPQCGKSMVPTHNKITRKDGSIRVNYFYFCCSYNSGGSTVCRANYLNADLIEKWFFSQLQRLLNSATAIESITEAASAKQDESRQPLLDQLQQFNMELSQLESRQKQVFQAFENNSLSHEGLLETLSAIESRQSDLRHQRKAVEHEITSHSGQSFPVEKIRSALQQLCQVLDLATEDRQKRLLRLLVDKIVLPPNRDISCATIFGTAELLNINITQQTEEL